MKLLCAAAYGFCALIWGGLEPCSAADTRTKDLRSATLIVGRISADPRKTIPRLERFASYLSEHLSSAGIRRSEVLVASDVPQMVEFLREGKVDLVSESPLTALYLEEQGVAGIGLREWKRGVPEYHSVLFAKQEAGLRSLHDLVGRKIAVEDRHSTTAFYLPLAELRRAGLQAVELAGPEVTVPPGKVGYVFAGSEINIGLWVARGLVDAGAFSNLDWQDHDRAPETIRSKFLMFHQTAPIIRSLLLIRTGLDEKIQAAIAEVLTSAHEDPEAAPVLEKYYRVGRFDRLTGNASRSLDEARSVYAEVREFVK